MQCTDTDTECQHQSESQHNGSNVPFLV